MGVDCGVDGALALLRPDGSLLRVIDMPVVNIAVNKQTRHRVSAALLADTIRRWAPDHAVVEAINPRKGDGPSMGELLRAAGIVEGVLAALGVPTTLVQPIAWRNAMQCRGPSGEAPEAKRARKEASRLRALQLWPDKAAHFARKEDSDRAEAALVGRWGCLCTALGGLPTVEEAA